MTPAHLLDQHAQAIGLRLIPASSESMHRRSDLDPAHLAADGERPCACGKHRLEVVSTPASDDPRETRRDFHVLCSCGAAATCVSHDRRPDERRITCEACAERVERVADFAYFAALAARRGWRVER